MMTNRYMIRLILKQLQVLNAIIGCISVYVMNNFLWFKRTSQVFFHNQAMFKNIILICIRMIFGSRHQNVTVFSNFLTSFPGWTKRAFPSEHIIFFSSRARFTKHGIFITSYISVICRIFIGQVFGDRSTASRAIQFIRTWILPKLFTTSFTFTDNALDFCFIGTLSRAIKQIFRRKSLITFPAIGTGSSNHGFSFFPPLYYNILRLGRRLCL